MKDRMRQFKRHYHKTRVMFANLKGKGRFGLQLKSEQTLRGSNVQATLETPDPVDTVRFVNLMYRFLNPKDRLFLKDIWISLQLRFPAFSDDAVSGINLVISQWQAGFGTINIDGQEHTPQMIYDLVCESGYFHLNDDSVRRAEEIKKFPILDPFLMNQFYDYSLQGFRVASALFDVISRCEIEWDEVDAERNGETECCIYCRGSGPFSSEEHIVSESLGNDDAVLQKGNVCDKCNHEVLSGLDNALNNFDPIAMLRVENVMYTKAGKFPIANFPTFRLEKTSPREIKIISKNGDSIIRVGEQLGDDLFQYHISWTGKQVDWKLIGRALFKVGLGMIAFKQGKSAALDTKFDAARRFVVENSELDTSLLLLTNFIPSNIVSVEYYDGIAGTPFVVNIFGCVFIFCLEGNPMTNAAKEFASFGFEEFSLLSTKP